MSGSNFLSFVCASCHFNGIVSRAIVFVMEVEYSGGGLLIFYYLIFIHQFVNFGGLRVAKLSRGSLIRVSSLAAALMARQ